MADEPKTLLLRALEFLGFELVPGVDDGTALALLYALQFIDFAARAGPCALFIWAALFWGGDEKGEG